MGHESGAERGSTRPVVRQASQVAQAYSASGRFGLQPPAVAKAKVQIFSDRSFQYSADGRNALVYPVVLNSGDQVDTVGWFREQPARWWLLRRIGTHLGDQALCHAAFFQEPVRLVPTPSAWLSSPIGAMCVLDWATNLRALFREVPEIRCATSALAEHLRRRLAEQVHHGFKIRVSP
jgi:hypothetical protein